MYYGSALLLFTCKLHCLQIFEHMSANWTAKVEVFCEVSYIISTRVFKVLRETCILISCGRVLLFTNMYLSCIHVRDGVVLWQSITGVLLYYAKVSPL